MKRGLIPFSLLLFAASCDKNSYSVYSTKYKVYFTCETNVSPYNQIFTPGRFLSVRKSDGMLVIKDSDGETRKEPLTETKNRTYVMGLAGLIIGTPTFNNDFSHIYAYDLGCPECDAPTVRLKFDLQGTASCSKCGGSWNLNSDGSPINTDGKQMRPLYRYPTSYVNGILTVQN